MAWRMRMQWTEQDRAIAAAMGVGLEDVEPAAVVSIEMYLNTVASAEYATRAHDRQLRNCRRLWRRYCRQRRALVAWRFAAAMLGIWFVAWVIGAIREAIG